MSVKKSAPTDISALEKCLVENILSYVGIIRIRYMGLYLSGTLSASLTAVLKLPFQSVISIHHFLRFVKWCHPFFCRRI